MDSLYCHGFTVTTQAPVFVGSATEVAVMVAEPTDKAMIKPLGVTATTAGLLLVHVTVLIEALAGVMVAVSVSVFPAANDSVVLFTVTPVTAT